MLIVVTTWLISNGLSVAGWSIAAIVLGWLIKKIPFGKWAKQLGNAGQKHGAAATTIAAKKVPLWNKIIEPVIIDFINCLLAYVAGFIIGLKSDN